MASTFVRFSEWFSGCSPVVKALVVVAGGGVVALVGVVAAPLAGAALSAAGLGAAGGTLSGAAASSAGLAALGGGSMAAGGMGVAGGTAVVSAAAGALGTAGSAYATHRVSQAGAQSRLTEMRARTQPVHGDDIVFEEG